MAQAALFAVNANNAVHQHQRFIGETDPRLESVDNLELRAQHLAYRSDGKLQALFAIESDLAAPAVRCARAVLRGGRLGRRHCDAVAGHGGNEFILQGKSLGILGGDVLGQRQEFFMGPAGGFNVLLHLLENGFVIQGPRGAGCGFKGCRVGACIPGGRNRAWRRRTGWPGGRRVDDRRPYRQRAAADADLNGFAAVRGCVRRRFNLRVKRVQIHFQARRCKGSQTFEQGQGFILAAVVGGHGQMIPVSPGYRRSCGCTSSAGRPLQTGAHPSA